MPAKVTFADFVVDWKKGKPDISGKTLGKYNSQLKLYLLPSFGERTLTSITTADIRKWLHIWPTLELVRRPFASHIIYCTRFCRQPSKTNCWVETLRPASNFQRSQLSQSRAELPKNFMLWQMKKGLIDHWLSSWALADFASTKRSLLESRTLTWRPRWSRLHTRGQQMSLVRNFVTGMETSFYVLQRLAKSALYRSIRTLLL